MTDPLDPVRVQRIEGFVLLVAAVIGFASTDVSWWWFAGLLLVPDLFAAGYLVNPRVGATTYNLGHNLLLPALLFGWYLLEGPSWTLPAAWVWVAHIGMDRLFGYGLKFGDAFTHTHLGTIGPRRRVA